MAMEGRRRDGRSSNAVRCRFRRLLLRRGKVGVNAADDVFGRNPIWKRRRLEGRRVDLVVDV